MPGSIVLRPIEANLTHNTELIGKMDPYVQVLLDGHKLRTNVCRKGGKHPMWDDSITIPAYSNNGIALVEVKDKDLLHDDRIGSFELDLREVESQGTLKKWFPLLHKDKPAGEILMEAIFSADSGFQGQGLGYGMNQPMGTGLGTGVGTGLIGGGLAGQSGFLPGQAGYTGAPYTAPLTDNNLQTQGAVPNPGYKSLSEQFAEEALLRSIDPLHSHSVYQNNTYPTNANALLNSGNLNNTNIGSNLVQKDRNLLVNNAGGFSGLPGQSGLIGGGLPGQSGLIGGAYPGQGISDVPLGQAGLLPATGGFVSGTGVGTGLASDSAHTVKNQHSIPMQHSNFTPVGTGLGADYLTNNVTTIGHNVEAGHHGQFGTVIKEGLNPTTQGPKGTANAETYDRKIQNL